MRAWLPSPSRLTPVRIRYGRLAVAVILLVAWRVRPVLLWPMGQAPRRVVGRTSRPIALTQRCDLITQDVQLRADREQGVLQRLVVTGAAAADALQPVLRKPQGEML